MGSRGKDDGVVVGSSTCEPARTRVLIRCGCMHERNLNPRLQQAAVSRKVVNIYIRTCHVYFVLQLTVCVKEGCLFPSKRRRGDVAAC